MSAGVVLLGGCNTNAFCNVRTADITHIDDGGLFRCIASEDCPRTANINVCLTNTTPDQQCVQCYQTRCQQVLPERCQ